MTQYIQTNGGSAVIMGDLFKPLTTQTRIYEQRLLSNTTQGVSQKQAPLHFKGKHKDKLTGEYHTMEETFPLFDVSHIKNFY